jgi:hypothetical protein
MAPVKVLPGTQIESNVSNFIKVSSGQAYFPGPQPISIERRHLGILKRGDYVICEKTDGVRHVLVSLVIGDKKMSVLVNRALEMWVIPVNFPKPVYQGTILDGELIDGTFLVYDALVVSGTSVLNMYLNERLEIVSGVVKGILRMKSDPVSVKVKKFFNLKKEAEKFFKEHLPSITFKMDGLIFTPVKEPVRTGTHETMFKWKPRDGNTIDFQFKRWDEQKKWGMYVLEKGRLIFESELLYEKTPEWITEEDCIVECQYMCDEEPRWWKPIGLRTDKTHPNNRRTFYRTLVNIKEDIQIQEFI